MVTIKEHNKTNLDVKVLESLNSLSTSDWSGSITSADKIAAGIASDSAEIST